MLNICAEPVSSWRPLFSSVLAQDCALCGHGGRELVCAGCSASLIRVESACLRCAMPLAHAGTCGACRKRAPAFDNVSARFQYRFPLDRLVQRFKYAGDLALGHWLGEQLAGQVSERERPDLIIAPPSTTGRLRERGFNPALEIAKVVARKLEIPCALEGLIRTRDTTPQPGLGRGARARNLEGAMHCVLPLGGMNVALVDDVMTTGATANAAARVLKKAGAASVSVWVAARTP